MTSNEKILLNESELFSRMSTGDQQAFTQIFYHYTQRLYNFILSKTKSNDLTEEIIQEIFIKLWNKREELHEVENYEAYIFTIANNKTYDFLRKMATEEKLKRKVWSSMQLYSNITAESIDLKYSEQLINQATDLLPPQRRKVFVLSKQKGLSRQEIAKELNISPNTVDNHLREALIFIKEYLQKTPGASVALLMILLKINS